jgi:hypothetical protein
MRSIGICAHISNVQANLRSPSHTHRSILDSDRPGQRRAARETETTSHTETPCEPGRLNVLTSKDYSMSNAATTGAPLVHDHPSLGLLTVRSISPYYVIVLQNKAATILNPSYHPHLAHQSTTPTTHNTSSHIPRGRQCLQPLRSPTCETIFFLCFTLPLRLTTQ